MKTIQRIFYFYWTLVISRKQRASEKIVSHLNLLIDFKVLKTFHVLKDLILLSIFIFWQQIDGRRFIILSNKYGNIGNQLYMTCFLVHWLKFIMSLLSIMDLLGMTIILKIQKMTCS